MAESGMPRTVAESLAMQARAEAKRVEGRELAPTDPQGAAAELAEADSMLAAGAAVLTLDRPPRIGAGGEALVPTPDECDFPRHMVETLKASPDRVNADASLRRVRLAAEAKALDLATDAAQTIQARNSVERALAHQFGAAHALAMKLAGKAQGMLSDTPSYPGAGPQEEQWRSVEAARLATASARMMDAAQRAALAVERLRSGGRQVVRVEHMQIVKAENAMVTGAVPRRHPSRRKATA